MPINRRQILLLAAKAGVISSVTGLSACSTNEGYKFGTLATAQESLINLVAAGIPKSDTTFTWAQTLEHLAQSIEFSLVGFPQSKSELFQKTAGAIAFKAFAWRGQMTHNLSDPIPGAPVPGVNSDPKQSLERLLSAIAAFRNWSGRLHPHFAYGELDKESYELAHSMHIANHISEFRSAS